MSDRDTKSFKDKFIIPGILTVFGILATLVITAIFPAIQNMWSRFFIWAGNILTTWYPLPGWAWLVILPLILIGLVSIYRNIRGEVERPDHEFYTEDYINNVVWRWEWWNNGITDLKSYCPRCDAQLIIYVTEDRRTFEHISNLYCENCKKILMEIDVGNDQFYLVSAIKREIDRRVRTNLYKQSASYIKNFEAQQKKA
ncbi:MAG: hypothetical protein R6X34_05810 [Chloroflexota bacterium]